MAYIFLDESGDLGFDFSKSKTSNYFIISFLFLKDQKIKNSVGKIVKKIYQNFSKTGKRHHGGTLHCYKEEPKTRLRLLNLLAQKDISIITIYLNKRKVYTKLQNEKQVLYNYVVNILLDRLFTKKLVPLNEKIFLIASRRETNKFFNENFKDYLKNQSQNNHNVDIDVCIKTPFEEKCLQIADFVCWSIFNKHEHGDETYYNLLKRKIIEENSLFP